MQTHPVNCSKAVPINTKAEVLHFLAKNGKLSSIVIYNRQPDRGAFKLTILAKAVPGA